MLSPVDGSNISGPSAIAAPQWLPNRLGNFYLYFAHHHGSYIRLAYADDLAGPWKIHPGGSLQLADAPGCRDHVASPDVHVDHDRREIRMYFHGVSKENGAQLSFGGRSLDGVHFSAAPRPVAQFYLKAVPWRDGWIGMTKGGQLYLGRDNGTIFATLRNPAFPLSGPMANGRGDIRHVALHAAGDRLHVFYTRIGDAPERILRGHIDLNTPPNRWHVVGSRPVLHPQAAWEGAQVPVSPSRPGAARTVENALRDPAILDHAGRLYLFYAAGGEHAIGVTEIPPLA